MSTPDYANYGDKRPEIPEGWEEVGYRRPRKWDTILDIDGQLYMMKTDGLTDFVIVRRKSDLDPALVPPPGYQFRLDEYGRPVCRAPKLGEWFVTADRGHAKQCALIDWDWKTPMYIVDPIPEPPKMTLGEARDAAIKSGKTFVRSRSDRELWPATALPKNTKTDDWEVVP